MPILYSFRRCPYAIRARMAMNVSAIAYVIREVSLQAKPAAMIEVSPKGTVPVLVLPDGSVIDESLNIMHWALDQHDPEQWLVPVKQVNELVAINDGAFKFHLDRMKYANRHPGANPVEHRVEAAKLLEPLEAKLKNAAYLFGSTPSLADVAVFPFVRQFAHADSKAFAALSMPYLQAWLVRWEASALFQSVMIKHPVWQPSHEDMHA